MLVNTILVGDVLDRLRELPDGLAQCCVSSPPYWGLRSYSVEAQVWGGDTNCEHEWITSQRKEKSGGKNEWSRSRFFYGEGEASSVVPGDAEGFCRKCCAWYGDYGLEPTPDEYAAHTVEICRELRRVLRDDGTLWWNLGDSYSGSGKGIGSDHGKAVFTDDDIAKTDWEASGLKPLDLCMIPARVALALQADGWTLRSVIVWDKPNPMPESVNGWRWERHRVKVKKQKGHGGFDGGKPSDRRKLGLGEGSNSYAPNLYAEWRDCPGCPKCAPHNGYVLRRSNWRPTSSYEYILMFAKQVPYYCDAEAVREDSQTGFTRERCRPDGLGTDEEKAGDYGFTSCGISAGRNKRNVWRMTTKPFPGAHFATFPPELPETCIKAGTSERGQCPKCGSAWARVVDTVNPNKLDVGGKLADLVCRGSRNDGNLRMGDPQTTTLDWWPTCECPKHKPVPQVVLDIFGGAGTTGLVARQLGRDFILIELNPIYAEMAYKRIKDDNPLFNADVRIVPQDGDGFRAISLE